MSRRIVTVNLAGGITDPFKVDREPADKITYGQNGEFSPQVEIIDVANALPTEYGYISYFDINKTLGEIPAAEIQDVLAVRTLHGLTVLIALTASGLFVCCPGSADAVAPAEVTPVPTVPHLVKRVTIPLSNGGFAWTLLAAAPVGSPMTPQWWTWAIIKNRILFYQCGLGAIVEVTDDKTATFVANWFNPTSIIGTYDLYRWRITGALDTQTCTVTEQTITLNVVGSFAVNGLNKAHIAAVAPMLWRQRLQNILGAGVIIE